MKSLSLYVTVTLSFLLFLSPRVFATSNDDLYKAIISNNVAGVKAAIADGADVNKNDVNGNTPLSTAVWNKEILQLLLDAKADPNKFDNNKVITGLSAAASWGEADAIKMMIKAGGNPNITNKDGYTPLHYACFNSSSVAAIQALIDGGADINAKTSIGLTPFHLYLKEGKTPADKVKQIKSQAPWIEKSGVVLPAYIKNPEEANFSTPGQIITYLVSKGVDINEKIVMQLTDADIMALRVSMLGKFTGTRASGALEKVLQKMRDKKIYSYPVLLACEKGKIDAMKVLVEKGANLDVENSVKANPMWFAAYSGDYEAYKMVKDKVKNNGVNHKDAVGVTVLMAAAMGGNSRIAEDLLASGADIDATDQFNATALHYAAAYNQPEVVTALLNKKADYDIAKKNIEGMETEGDFNMTSYGFTSYSKTITTYKQTTPLGIAKINQEDGKKGDYSKVIAALEAAGASKMK